MPSTNAPMRVPGISNVVLVAAADGSDGGAHTLAVTVEHGTNHYWAWGRDDVGQVGNGTNGVIQSSPQQLVFPCVQYIQLGTGGTFQAQCTGTLTLYFNDDVYGDNLESYSVTITNLGTVTVIGSNSQGVVVGTVSNGVTYSYSASGLVTWSGQSDQTDPNGDNPDGILIDCDASHGSTHYNGESRNGFPSPCAICYSLVGKIQ